MTDEPAHAGTSATTEADAWRRALDQAARRIREDRGISDDYSIDTYVVVRLGDVELTVGTATDVTSPDDLEQALDEAVAFERGDGPGRWLPRDQERLLRMQEGTAAAVPVFERVGGLLAADLQRTAGVRSDWTVRHIERDDRFSERVDGRDVGRPAMPSIVVDVTFDGGSGSQFSTFFESPLGDVEAIHELLSLSWDTLVEEVWGRWPLCANHVAELQVVDAGDGTAVWSCPVDEQLWDPVGQLRPESTQRD